MSRSIWPATRPTARTECSRITMSMSRDADSPPPFLIGANLPWVHYGIDFGANAWRPDGGISQPAERAQLDAAFAAPRGRWRAMGAMVSLLRWARRHSIQRRRTPAWARRVRVQGCRRRARDRAPPWHRDHVRAARFSLVRRGQRHAGRANGRTGARPRGRRKPRERCLENVMRPLLERYGAEPRDFRVGHHQRTGVDHNGRGAGSPRRFSAKALSLMHAMTEHPVTIGSAGVRWRDRYAGLGLDFYQVHWYDSLKHQPSLETPVIELGFDRPVLLGEFPTRGSTRTPAEIVEAARRAGYSGAFYWSVLSKRRVLRLSPSPRALLLPTACCRRIRQCSARPPQ